MLVETIRCLEDNFSYILIDQNKNACVIDPSESEPIINFVELLSICISVKLLPVDKKFFHLT